MKNEKQVDYYNILKHCVDDTIHPRYTRYVDEEVAIFVGSHKLYLRADQKGNLYYKVPTTKSDNDTWIKWNKVSDLTSIVNSSFGSFGWEFSLFIRWIYEKYADAVKVGVENRVWSMDLFYKTRLILVEKLEQHITESTLDRLTLNVDNRVNSETIDLDVMFNYYRGCLDVGRIEFSPHESVVAIRAKLSQLKAKYGQLGNQYNNIDYIADCIFTAYTQVSPSIAGEKPMTEAHTHNNVKVGQSTFKPYVPNVSDPNSPPSIMSQIFSALHSSNDW